MLKRIEDYDKTLPVLEVYTAVQSEGSRQGYPTIVIRTTGCTHRCLMILLKCMMKTPTSKK